MLRDESGCGGLALSLAEAVTSAPDPLMIRGIGGFYLLLLNE